MMLATITQEGWLGTWIGSTVGMVVTASLSAACSASSPSGHVVADGPDPCKPLAYAWLAVTMPSTVVSSASSRGP
jgi:hypothetical protein